eukprot:jgi/Chlat1/7497/Chrsp61S07016
MVAVLGAVRVGARFVAGARRSLPATRRAFAAAAAAAAPTHARNQSSSTADASLSSSLFEGFASTSGRDLHRAGVRGDAGQFKANHSAAVLHEDDDEDIHDATDHVAEGPLAEYHRRVDAGELRPGDPRQVEVVAGLQRLYDQLEKQTHAGQSRGWLSSWFSSSPPPSIRGIYMYGGVGTGKTMMMDLFYTCAPVEAKRRVHFHSFMLDVHHRIHELAKTTSGDPVPKVAQEIASSAKLLCFDELEVTDVADALLLRRLFDILFENGCVVVATSNRSPDELYKNGLNRQLFLPFIAEVKQKCEVYDLSDTIDYRSRNQRIATVFNAPLTPDVQRHMDTVFKRLAGTTTPQPRVIPVMMGRKLAVPAQVDNEVCRFSFDQLCGRSAALGVSDYLALTSEYKALVLDNVPRLTMYREGEARRFINLVDVMYEHHMLLVASAETPVDKLFDWTREEGCQGYDPMDPDVKSLETTPERTQLVTKSKPSRKLWLGSRGHSGQAAAVEAPADHGVQMWVDTKGGAVGQSGATMVGGMEWSGTGLKTSLADLPGNNFTYFASSRTISRLVEMQTAEYVEKCNEVGPRLLGKR